MVSGSGGLLGGIKGFLETVLTDGGGGETGVNLSDKQ